MPLKDQITEQQKTAMRARNKVRLGTLRMLMAEIKQQEVDKRIELDDQAIIATLTKMVKQRKDSFSQYQDAGRQELADIESAEITVLQEFLPQALTEAEIEAVINQAIAETGASSMQAMGQVMALIKPKIQGRADLGVVSGLVKAKLT